MFYFIFEHLFQEMLHILTHVKLVSTLSAGKIDKVSKYFSPHITGKYLNFYIELNLTQ